MDEAITPSLVTLLLRNQWLHSIKSSNRFKLIQVHCSVALSNSQLCEYRKLAACHWFCFQLQFEAHLYCCAWVLCKAESLFELSFECLLENPLSFCILPCISAFSGTLNVTNLQTEDHCCHCLPNKSITSLLPVYDAMYGYNFDSKYRCCMHDFETVNYNADRQQPPCVQLWL